MIKKKKPRNKFEKRIDRQLRKAKVSYDYEPEKIPYVLSGHYIPDFVININKYNLNNNKYSDISKIYIECKGYFRPEDKRKLLAVKRCHPTYDIRIVFYEIRKPWVKWAEKHKFPYSIETIPNEWLNNDTREMVH